MALAQADRGNGGLFSLAKFFHIIYLYCLNWQEIGQKDCFK
jgi:hypothetical protein